MVTNRWSFLGVLALFAVTGGGCVPATSAPPPAAPIGAAPLSLPAFLDGKATVLAATDPDYARAGIDGAVKPDGKGGLISALVVKLGADVPVWRMWNGPAKKDAQGHTNRIGQWWSYDAPHGTRDGYRTAYEICGSWNDLTWMAKCTLRAGAVVAIGPGQSVAATECAVDGSESYPQNGKDWQVWIGKAWARLGADKELDCPDESADYEADPADISKPRISPGAPQSR